MRKYGEGCCTAALLSYYIEKPSGQDMRCVLEKENT